MKDAQQLGKLLFAEYSTEEKGERVLNVESMRRAFGVGKMSDIGLL